MINHFLLNCVTNKRKVHISTASREEYFIGTIESYDEIGIVARSQTRDEVALFPYGQLEMVAYVEERDAG